MRRAAKSTGSPRLHRRRLRITLPKPLRRLGAVHALELPNDGSISPLLHRLNLEFPREIVFQKNIFNIFVGLEIFHPWADPDGTANTLGPDRFPNGHMPLHQ